VLLVGCATVGAAAFVAPFARCDVRTAPTRSTLPVVRKRVAAMSAALPDVIVAPPKLPSFGLSEPEIIRMNHMVLSSEPLPHEIIGLQVLLAAVGTYLAGAIGALLGSCHLAPCLGWMPGSAGNAVRALGWRAFVAIRATTHWTLLAWHRSGLHACVMAIATMCARLDQASGASAAAGAACQWLVRLVWRAFVGMLRLVTSATSGGALALRRGAQGRERGSAPPAPA